VEKLRKERTILEGTKGCLEQSTLLGVQGRRFGIGDGEERGIESANVTCNKVATAKTDGASAAGVWVPYAFGAVSVGRRFGCGVPPV